MRISHPLQMNDWPIKKFLVVVLALLGILWVFIGLEAIGIEIPLLRTIIGFVYLSLVPGVIILRIFKLHTLGSIETLLYSVGLSLATIMFTGALINAVYPFFGISKPISTLPLMITFTILTLTLCVIVYLRDKNFSASTYVDIKGLLSPPVLFLCLIPLLSMLGTQLVNFYDSNVLLMVLIGVIALTVLLIGFTKFIPSSLYPLAVFAMALSLLFYRSLISNYVTGFDTHEEYYVANLVKTTGIWDPATPMMVNSMLSLTMLAPIISEVASIDLTLVFKVVYPLLFSLVPLGLFHLFRKQSDERMAFLSCFFFIAVSDYYVKMPVLIRQQVATIFLLLLTLLMIDQQMSGTRKTFLFIVFGASLVVSHYGLSYVYIAYLVFAWIVSVFLDNQKIKEIRDKLFTKLGFQNKNNEKPDGNHDSLNTGSFGITLTFIEMFIVVAFVWYMFTSGSRSFNSLIFLGVEVISNFTADFLNPEGSHGLAVLLTQWEPGLLHAVNVIINYLNQIFIIMGFLILLWKYRELKFRREYAIFSFFSLIIIFAGVLVPLLTLRLDMERLYRIALTFLAPFLVIGALETIRSIERLFEELCKKIHVRALIKISGMSILSVYLVVFFFYQTGLFWQLTEGYSGSVSISQVGLKKYGNMIAKAQLYLAITLEQDVFSARWLSTYRELGERVYAIYNDTSVHPLLSYGMMPIEEVLKLTPTTEIIPEDAYVYLQYWNVVEGIGIRYDPGAPLGRTRSAYSMSEVSHLFDGKNKIYSNGGSEIYK